MYLQGNDRLPEKLLLASEVCAEAQVSAVTNIPLFVITPLRREQVEFLSVFKMDIEEYERKLQGMIAVKIKTFEAALL